MGTSGCFLGCTTQSKGDTRNFFEEELGSIRGLWEGPWCLRGDFNEILSPNERSRGGRLSPIMRRFFEILNDLVLRDLLLQGGPYTWRGGQNGRLMSRLDKFLVFADWESPCSKAIKRCLPRPISDHSPILLDNDGVRTGPSPFRFELL